MPSKTFRSKLDGWVAASLVAGGLIQALVLVVVAATAPKALFVVVPLLLLICTAVAWLYFSTRYVVTEHQLLIRSGPVRVDIPLAHITSVEATRNPLSAPAWSLDRLQIGYGQGRYCMISPKAKEQFLDLLRERGARVA